ncbi:hypothetical protein SAMN04490182_2225 [Pseudomonas cedrina]|uniref:Uncharacterized protein n=2 Tax=Pseudomonas cedrina TaxID=651740 RepID=A0A1V2JXX7_PSECE|nr:hypothetical protein [Pseudomonas cedrina]ONH50004.1 hypothetical protein BLL36_27380 [Pseudomonas cedrina subsp. cedrina]SDS72383.1 hypothetical protein SAMN04490182_2225 [Pseudomonas cedrina]
MLISSRAYTEPNAASLPPSTQPLSQAGHSRAPEFDQQEFSQAAADKAVLQHYIQALESAQWTHAEGYEDTHMDNIPRHSSIGQWWQQYRDAVQNPAFLLWCEQRGLDIFSIVLEPHSGFLSGSFHGKQGYLRPESDAGWKAISAPILEAAKVLVPAREGHKLVLEAPTAGIPLAVVGNFYGETHPPETAEQARARAQALKQAGGFAPTPSSDMQRSPMARGTHALAEHRQRLADISDRYSLVIGDPLQSSEATADRALALHYSDMLREQAWGEALGYGTRLPDVSAHSRFGQWWQVYCDTFKSPDFLAWAASSGLDLQTMVVSQRDGSVVGTFNGRPRSLSLKDDSGWSSVAGPILAAGAAIAPDPRFNFLRPPIGFPENAPPLMLVGAFYGENTRALSKAQAKIDADRLARNQAPFNRAFTEPDPRSTSRLAAQRLALGVAQDRFNLIQALGAVEQAAAAGPMASVSGLLDSTSMQVHPHAGFAQQRLAGGPTQVSLKQFLQGSGFELPSTREQLMNLLKVLSFQLPEPGTRGDYWPLLGKQLLTTQQRTQVSAQIEQAARAAGVEEGGNVWQALAGPDISSGLPLAPDEVLERMLSNPAAEKLGKALEAALNGKSSGTSALDWTLTALVLDLDPAAGTRRNHVAGYDLAQSDNWGRPPAQIIDNLARHLVAQGKVRQAQAPAAARLLLGHMGPEFLVRDIPTRVVYGSHTWASLASSVARIEQIAPGTSRNMTFKQVMTFGQSQPVTAVGRQIQSQAQRNALVDWAVANGVVAPRADDAYPQEQLAEARTRFNQRLAQLVQASNVQQSQAPSRRDMALAELKTLLGSDVDVETPSIKSEEPFDRIALYLEPFGLYERLRDATAERFSILELYMAGAFAHPTVKWVSEDPTVQFDQVKETLEKQPDFKQRFHREFQDYLAAFKGSIAVNVQNMIAQLPLEDRKNLAYGQAELYSVREGFFVNSRTPYEAQAQARRGHFGLLIRTHRTSPSTCYELFPAQGILRKNPQLPDTFELGPSNAAQRPEVFAGGVTQGVESGRSMGLDYAAYLQGTVPRANARSDDLIIDRLPLTATASGENGDGAPDSYAHPSSVAIAQAAANFVLSDVEAMEKTAEGTTNYEKHQQFDQRVKETLINLIPFVSAYRKAGEGDYTGAFTDAELDVFGLLMPGLHGVLSVEDATEKLGGAGFTAASAQQAEMPMAIGKKFGSLSAQGYGLNPQHLVTPAQLETLSQREDVAVGNAQVDAKTVGVIAQYDKPSAQWYGYDVQGGNAYGLALTSFTPQVSTALRNAMTHIQEVAIDKMNLLDRNLKGSNEIALGGTMQAITQIDGELYTFEDTVKGVTRLNICAHGRELDTVDVLLGDRHTVLLNDVEYSPEQVLNKIRAKQIDPSRYDNVRLLICYAGRGNEPFAKEFQRLIQRPVHAFAGTVTATHGSTPMSKIFAKANELYGTDGEKMVRSLYANSQHHVAAVNPYFLLQEPVKYLKFSHRPVTFT